MARWARAARVASYPRSYPHGPMSLLNAWVTPTEATVAVDTDGMDQEGGRIVASKLLTIPHLGAVIGLRGQAAFLAFTFLRCLSASHATFDEMLDSMPAHLAATDAELPPELIALEGGEMGNELIAVGWSDRKAAMLGRRFVRRGGTLEFAIADFDLHISPWHQGTMNGLPVRKPSAIERIAAAQVDWMRSTFNAICGGQLLVCEVRRRSVTVSRRAAITGVFADPVGATSGGSR